MIVRLNRFTIIRYFANLSNYYIKIETLLIILFDLMNQNHMDSMAYLNLILLNLIGIVILLLHIKMGKSA